jgi:hypothetical protein
VVALTTDQFLQTASLESCEIIAYCFMQESFFDRTHRQEDDLADVIRYVINNPIRGGLVEAPADCRFWGSQDYTREEILEFVRDTNPCRV